jgi:hypothetical protein
VIEVADVQNAIDLAEKDDAVWFPDVEGYTSPKVCRLLNGLCRLPDVTYLEIGVHLGKTFLSSQLGNRSRATCIDNWSLMGDLRAQFEANLKHYLPTHKLGKQINLIESNCFLVELEKIWQPVNVYFYDGAHDRDSQYLAFTHFNSIFAGRFVAIVDDCNWAEPREETKRAFKDLHYNVLKDWDLPGVYNGDQKGWWNRLYVAVVEKP